MNVIDVDFRRNRPPDPVGIAEEGISLAKQAIASWQWYEDQWLLERKRVGALRRALLNECARNFPYSDQDVAEALRRVYRGEPLAASKIAVGLFAHPPTHSARVRLGLALSRLASAGAVVQHRPPDDSHGRITCRWEPADA